MAESTSIDARTHNGQTDYLSPRPRKPTRIDLLKPQLGEEAFNRDGTLKEPGSGVSRLVNVRFLSKTRLTRPVDEQLQSPQMRLLQSKRRHRHDGRSEPSRKSASSILSSTWTACPISIQTATIMTFVASSSSFGSAWQSWSLQPCFET